MKFLVHLSAKHGGLVDCRKNDGASRYYTTAVMLFYPLDRTGGSHLPTSPLTPVPSPLYLLPDIFRYTASYLLGVVTYIIHRGYQTPTSLSLYSVKTPTKANRRPFMTFDLTDPLTLC